GFWHILRSFRKPETVDFLLAATRPGATAGAIRGMMWVDMYDMLLRRGIKFSESNHQLEDNKAANIFTRFEVIHRRRARVFRLALAGTPNA
ncbi:MAG: hypothetical protein ACR2QU_02960, partial [Gammaproteobacteria bacterium]